MCLYPRLVPNPKYKPNKKNNFNPPACTDMRVAVVPIKCGKCIECRGQKSREWQIRLNEEIKVNNYKYFVTLTFNNEELSKLCNETDTKESNAVAALAVRRFLERWRKKNKKSLKHWLITELGHQGTERIHLHGIIFSDKPIEENEIKTLWKYGNIFVGNYCNERTVNYIIKYVTKLDIEHKGYEPQIFCTAGMGKAYIDKASSKERHRYEAENTTEYYRLNNGCKVNMPIYFRNHFFNEKEREKLWIQRIETHTRYVNGIKIENIDTEQGQKIYNEILRKAQEDNIKMGFGSDSKEWSRREYNVTLKMLNKSLREPRAVRHADDGQSP